MNPKLFIGLLSGIPMAIVVYIFYDFGIHNKWQLFLFLYAIFWCIMPSMVITLKLDLFGLRTKIKTLLNKVIVRG